MLVIYFAYRNFIPVVLTKIICNAAFGILFNAHEVSSIIFYFSDALTLGIFHYWCMHQKEFYFYEEHRGTTS